MLQRARLCQWRRFKTALEQNGARPLARLICKKVRAFSQIEYCSLARAALTHSLTLPDRPLAQEYKGAPLLQKIIARKALMNRAWTSRHGEYASKQTLAPCYLVNHQRKVVQGGEAAGRLSFVAESPHYHPKPPPLFVQCPALLPRPHT